MKELPNQVDMDGEVVGFQVGPEGKVWVCVDGCCVLRVRGVREGHVDVPGRNSIKFKTFLHGQFPNEEHVDAG